MSKVRLTKKFVLLCMAVCGVYISSAVHSQHVEFTEVFMDSTNKRKCSSRKSHHGYAAFISDDENSCRLEEQRKETVHTHYLRD